MKDEAARNRPIMPSVRYDSKQTTLESEPKPAQHHTLAPARIEELAQQYRIPLYEDPGVVKALARLDMSETIPLELYGVIAEVLGFVYRLDTTP